MDGLKVGRFYSQSNLTLQKSINNSMTKILSYVDIAINQYLMSVVSKKHAVMIVVKL